MRRLAALCTLAVAIVAALLLAPAPADAHAVLSEVDPPDRAALDAPPDHVVLTFDEAVSLPTGGLRVFDAEARRIDTGRVDVGGPETVAVGLPDDLPAGGYVVTWRVVSDDDHPVGGVSTFTLGGAAPVEDALVADLFGGGGQLGVVGAGLRGLSYAGTLLAAGAVFVGPVLALDRPDRRRAAVWAVRGAIVGLAATVLAIPVQAMAVTGETLLGSLEPAVLGDVLWSGFGQSTLVRVVWLAVLAVFAARRAPVWATTVAGAAGLASFLLDGHQRSVEPTWLLVPADAVHLAAGAVWLGGLVVLASLVRSRHLDDDPVGAARTVSRFSTVALWSFGAVVAAGLTMSWVLVRGLRPLVTTDYGWTLLAKLGAVVLIGLVAVYNRSRLVPAIARRATPAGAADDLATGAAADRGATGTTADGTPADSKAADGGGVDAAGTGHGAATTVHRSRAAWGQLRSTLTAEVVLLVVVLAVTGALVTIRPAAQAAGVTGAFQTVTALTDDLDAELIVDPNEVGTNAIHLYVLDATGRPAEDVEEVTLELTYVPEDIGPLRVEPFFAGPGHWTANIDDLTFPGEWRIEVVAALDRFTEVRTQTTVVVNR